MVAGISFYTAATAQSTSKDTLSITDGKWVICTDTSFVEKFICAKPTSGLEFSPDGRYKEYPKTQTDPNKPFLEGSWTLKGKTLTLDQDDTPGTKEFPRTYTITWVDKNRFYSTDKEGKAGPQLYVYFQRLR